MQGGVTYQNQLVAYDTLGRLAHVEGMDGVNLDITYDKVGNKLRQTTTYNTESQRTVADYGQVLQTDESGNPVLDDAGNPVYMTEQIGSHTVYDATAHAQDQWFAYDAMNRQVLVDGAANGNAGDLSNLTRARATSCRMTRTVTGSRTRAGARRWCRSTARTPMHRERRWGTRIWRGTRRARG